MEHRGYRLDETFEDEIIDLSDREPDETMIDYAMRMRDQMAQLDPKELCKRFGVQNCHICPDLECADNRSDLGRE